MDFSIIIVQQVFQVMCYETIMFGRVTHMLDAALSELFFDTEREFKSCSHKALQPRASKPIATINLYYMALITY